MNYFEGYKFIKFGGVAMMVFSYHNEVCQQFLSSRFRPIENPTLSNTPSLLLVTGTPQILPTVVYQQQIPNIYVNVQNVF